MELGLLEPENNYINKKKENKRRNIKCFLFLFIIAFIIIAILVALTNKEVERNKHLHEKIAHMMTKANTNLNLLNTKINNKDIPLNKEIENTYQNSNNLLLLNNESELIKNNKENQLHNINLTITNSLNNEKKINKNEAKIQFESIHNLIDFKKEKKNDRQYYKYINGFSNKDNEYNFRILSKLRNGVEKLDTKN